MFENAEEVGKAMQVRDGSSRYPENLVERFTLQEEAARKYEPTEERTIVLNFAEHWNRSAERRDSRRFSPFKNSLSEQFGHISYELTRTRELVTYIWSSLYRLRTKTERTLYFSHPSFYKSLPDTEGTREVNMDNVAVRIPLKKHDLVLIGDLRTVNERSFQRREFVVKGMSILKSSPHAGEVRVDTAVIARVVNTGIPGFYTTKGELAEGHPGNVYGRSVIDGDLEKALNGLYIVSDPLSVLSVLNEWKDFQNVENTEAEANETKGYAIRPPEFIVGYPLPKHSRVQKDNVFLETPEAIWSDKVAGGARPRLVAKIVHNVSRKDFFADRNYSSKFNNLATVGVKIVDPMEILSSKKGFRNPNWRLARIGSERLAPAEVTGLPRKEDVRPLREKRDADVAAVRAEFREKREERTAELLDAYMATEEVASFLDEQLEGMSADIESKAREEFGEEYEAHLDEVREWFRKAKEQEVRESKRGSIAAEVRAGFSAEKRAAIDSIYDEYDRAVAELPSDSDTCELTIYFEVPLRGTDSVVDEAARRNEYFSRTGTYRMVCDQTGAQTNRTRLMDALDSLMRGEVMNPYLASYLFPSKELVKTQTTKIGHFFGSGFNEEQKRAVEEAVNSDGLYLIQGPPGTGKTQVISEITTQEVLRGRKVLITSQNNKAINNAFDRLYRNPMIRPVRLMSEGNQSEYDLDRMVDTFYKNITVALGHQLDNYGDEGFRDEVRARFGRLEKLHGELQSCTGEAEDSIEEIEYDEEDLRAILQKLDDIERDAEERESHRKLLDDLLSSLDLFELTTYSGDAEEIRSLFRPYVYIYSRDFREAETELDNKVFGRYGYCRKLMAIPEEQLADQVELMSANNQYVKLYRQILRTKDEKNREEMSQKLDEMVSERGIRTEEFTVMRMFGSDLPKDLLDLRDRLARIRAKTENAILREMDSIPDNAVDGGRAEKLRGQVEDINEELEEFRNDPAYIRYTEVEAEFSSLLQEMYFMLNLDERFSDAEGAYRILEHRVDLICAQDDSAREVSRRILGEVTEYLSREDVAGIDRDRLARELGNYVNVVGITCTAEGQGTLTLEGDSVSIDVTTMGIDVVIIDEISKVPFPEILRPILSGKTVIMVGDHKQLPPIYNVKYDRSSVSPDDEIVKREERFKELYTTPLFKTLFEKAPENSKIMLTKQYRMASQIMGVINRFYGGGLEMGCSDEDKRHRMTVEGPRGTVISPDNAVVFVNCNGTDTRQEGSTSFENALEAKVVSRLVEMMESACTLGADGTPKEDCSPEDLLSLGVISPYAAQTRLIRRTTDRFYDGLKKQGTPSSFRTTGEERFMVKSVDDFQGDERDIIILSLVRTGRSAFISDFRRINVAMSRARRLLVLVGDAESLMKEEVDIDGERRKVYAEIIGDIKAAGGYREADDIIGGE